MIELISTIAAFLIFTIAAFAALATLLLPVTEAMGEDPFYLFMITGVLLCGAIAYKLFTVIENKYGALLGGVV